MKIVPEGFQVNSFALLSNSSSKYFAFFFSPFGTRSRSCFSSEMKGFENIKKSSGKLKQNKYRKWKDLKDNQRQHINSK